MLQAGKRENAAAEQEMTPKKFDRGTKAATTETQTMVVRCASPKSHSLTLDSAEGGQRQPQQEERDKDDAEDSGGRVH